MKITLQKAAKNVNCRWNHSSQKSQEPPVKLNAVTARIKIQARPRVS